MSVIQRVVFFYGVGDRIENPRKKHKCQESSTIQGRNMVSQLRVSTVRENMENMENMEKSGKNGEKLLKSGKSQGKNFTL